VSIHSVQHIIQKQFLEIDFAHHPNGLNAQNELASLLYEKLLPRMEVLFDELGGENYQVSFETLEVDAGTLPLEHWEDALVEETLRAIRSELLAADKRSVHTHSPATKSEGTLLFFLQNGYLPWNSSVHSIHELERKADRSLVKKIESLIHQSPAIIERLVNNFSQEFVYAIIQNLSDEFGADIKQFRKAIAREGSLPVRKKMQSALIKKLIAEKQESVPVSQTKEIIKIPLNAEAINEEGIYIHNAGLVILHPFLPELFTTPGLFTENGWKDETAVHTAILILEYLVTGSDDCAECSLPFNKILCGLEPGEVWQAPESLPAETKAECDALLQAVIRHWSALKNTGIDALRETYLQRFGKLTRADHGWSLQPEPKVVDVLIGRLPWGIGTIRLPWMKPVLFTEWY
jgi:hypothetical protein